MNDKPTTYVTIVDTHTGEHAVCVDEWSEGYPDDSMRFMYEEGNYSCDCNRALFLARALGKPEPDVECWFGNRYHVTKFEVQREGARYELAGKWQETSTTH